MRKTPQDPTATLIAQASQHTRDLLEQAAVHYRIPVPRVGISFDLRGKSAGQVRFARRGQPLIRYNRQLLLENGEHFLQRTLPHEVAHVIAWRLFGPRIQPHGPEWKGVMALFRVDSSRCHDYDTSRASTRRLNRYPYHCGCREHALTSIRHNRVLAGQRYYCRACGEVLVAITQR